MRSVSIEWKCARMRVVMLRLVRWRRHLSSATSVLRMPIKVGDTLPSLEVHEGTPKNTVNVKELFTGKKGVLFGVPGAFTPSCSKTHLPSYVIKHEALKEKGVEVIACLTVNDVFVTAAWGEAQNVGDKIRMLADTTGKYTKALDLELDAVASLGSIRCKRFSMIIEDSVVKALNVEENSGAVTCTLSNALFDQL